MVKVFRFFIFIIIFCINGCYEQENRNFELQSTSSNISYDESFEYINDGKKIKVINKFSDSCDVIQDENIFYIKNVEDSLYYITYNESYMLKKLYKGEIYDICTIPIDEIHWCEILDDIIYIYSNNNLYGFNYNNKSVQTIQQNLKAQSISMYGNYIYYNEIVEGIQTDETGFIENIENAYIGWRINRIDLANGENIEIFTQKEEGHVYHIKQILAYSNGVILYLADGDMQKESIFLLDNNSKLKKLKEKIDTDNTYLATDGQYVYYVDTTLKNIMKINLQNKKTSIVYDYSSNGIENILGIALDDLYFTNDNGDIIQYNITSKGIKKF